MIIIPTSMSRRAFATTAVVPLLVPSFARAESSANKVKTVLVLGSTGLVGNQVVKKLESLNINVVGTSTDGRGGTKPLKISSPTLDESTARVAEIAKSVDAVISCVGSFNTPEDFSINSFTGSIASAVSVPVTYISVAPEVMESVKGLPVLTDYMRGKAFSNTQVLKNGGSLIQPTFIYGGDKFGVNPPRVTSDYGKLIESLLSSSPIRGLANVTPGLIKVALEPPVSAEDVAGSAVAKALGFEGDASTHDKIQNLAKKV